MKLGAALAAAAVIGGAVGPAPASAASGARMVAVLGAQRAANGLPAGVTENPTWSHDCAQHDAYMADNRLLTHTEDPTKPGYSTGGSFAGQNSVLIQGATWDAGNPYEFAPIHLDQLLAPRLAVTGGADADGFSCTFTFPGWTRADPPGATVYTYPGNGATIYPSEAARENPWTPGDLVGLHQPVRTGPYLIVFIDKPGQSPFDNPATISAATLTGPSGAVAVKTVDGTTAVHPYIAPGGFIIPVSPLRPNTSYRAHVTVSLAGTSITHDWSFATGGNDPESTLEAQGSTLTFHSRSPAPIRVTLTRANGAHAKSLTIAPGHHARLHLGPGSWRACGSQRATKNYAGYSSCLSIIVIGVPSIRFRPPVVNGNNVQFPVRFSTVLKRRRATLTITAVRVNCAGHPCTTTVISRTTRTIVLRGKSITVRLPRTGRGVRVVLSTKAFRVGDAQWDAARAVSETYVRR
jgi:hypothetical protein